jgi:hypothetical protein
MELNYTFDFWNNIFAIISIIVSIIIAVWIYNLSRRLSAKEKYQHEIRITADIQKLKIYESVILADVKKYHPLRVDNTNQTYYKQGAELYTVIPEYGVQFILMPSDKNIPVGLVPFEWIEYIREHDSEDNKPIIVCKFRGIKWFKRFKSPFKEVNYIYENPSYKENSDPSFMKFTTIRPSNLHTDNK